MAPGAAPSRRSSSPKAARQSKWLSSRQDGPLCWRTGPTPPPAPTERLTDPRSSCFPSPHQSTTLLANHPHPQLSVPASRRPQASHFCHPVCLSTCPPRPRVHCHRDTFHSFTLSCASDTPSSRYPDYFIGCCLTIFCPDPRHTLQRHTLQRLNRHIWQPQPRHVIVMQKSINEGAACCGGGLHNSGSPGPPAATAYTCPCPPAWRPRQVNAATDAPPVKPVSSAACPSPTTLVRFSDHLGALGAQ